MRRYFVRMSFVNPRSYEGSYSLMVRNYTYRYLRIAIYSCIDDRCIIRIVVTCLIIIYYILAAQQRYRM